MQQLEQQFESISLQPVLPTAGPKRKRLDESEKINRDEQSQLFPRVGFFNQFSAPLVQAIEDTKRRRYEP